ASVQVVVLAGVQALVEAACALEEGARAEENAERRARQAVAPGEDGGRQDGGKGGSIGKDAAGAVVGVCRDRGRDRVEGAGREDREPARSSAPARAAASVPGWTKPSSPRRVRASGKSRARSTSRSATVWTSPLRARRTARYSCSVWPRIGTRSARAPTCATSMRVEYPERPTITRAAPNRRSR